MDEVNEGFVSMKGNLGILKNWGKSLENTFKWLIVLNWNLKIYRKTQTTLIWKLLKLVSYFEIWQKLKVLLKISLLVLNFVISLLFPPFFLFFYFILFLPFFFFMFFVNYAWSITCMLIFLVPVKSKNYMNLEFADQCQK